MTQEDKNIITGLLILLLLWLMFRSQLQAFVTGSFNNQPIAGGLANIIGPTIKLSVNGQFADTCPISAHVVYDSSGTAWCQRD